jgi:molybdopterin synthase sulfur carrier subunit
VSEPATAATGVRLRLPSALRELAGGSRTLVLAGSPATVGAALDEIAGPCPALVRRIRDETGALRRFVNVYVDGTDVRHAQGLATALTPTSEVLVLPSIAGG